MSYHVVYNYLWPLLQMLLGGIEVATAVLLLRERGSAPWLMLAGAMVCVLGQLAIAAVSHVFPSIGNGNLHLYLALLSMTGLGSLVFSIGLLLHALRRRGQANRVAELEAILASIQKS